MITVPGALALTGVLFGFAAFILALCATEARAYDDERVMKVIAWSAFAVALALFASAIWLEALS
jgi:hypothetical protein